MAGVAGNDQFEGGRKCTAIRRTIAGERGEHLSCSSSHIFSFSVLSLLAELARCPSGVTATAVTALSGRTIACCSLPDSSGTIWP